MTQEDFSPASLQGSSNTTETEFSDVDGYPPRHPRRRKRPSRFITVFLGFCFGFVGGIAAILALPRLAEIQEISRLFDQAGLVLPVAPAVRQSAPFSVGGDAGDDRIVRTVEETSPSVVSIVISKDVPRLQRAMPFGFPFFSPFDDGGFGNGGSDGNGTGSGTKQTVGAGSGFFVSADGLIATNKHVVSDDGADYTVITSDGKEHPATVVARDPVRDIALIKISDSTYPALTLGDSGSAKVGQTVIAIGNSLGEFSNTVSKGIISGVQRDLTAGGAGDTEQLNDILQTDAAINPGNSGGPLLDQSGNVIGINVAMAQGAQNIGFAIPIDQVKKVIGQVQSTGKISTPFIGIRYVAVDAALQKENSLPFDYGVIVARGTKQTDFSVIPGSPADKAGIQENDIILEIGGKRIDANDTLPELLSDYNPGDTVEFKVWRKGDTKDVPITIGERNNQ